MIGSNEYFPADLLVAPTQDLRKKKDGPVPEDAEMAGEEEEEDDEEGEKEEVEAGGRRRRKAPPKRAAAKYDIAHKFRGGNSSVSS